MSIQMKYSMKYLLLKRMYLNLKRMTKEKRTVEIKPSDSLSLMRLNALIEREATITQDLTSIGRINKGYMVELTEPYLDEVDWFIPQESIDDED